MFLPRGRISEIEGRPTTCFAGASHYSVYEYTLLMGLRMWKSLMVGILRDLAVVRGDDMLSRWADDLVLFWG